MRRTAKHLDELLDNMKRDLLSLLERDLGLRIRHVETFSDGLLLTSESGGRKLELGIWDAISDEGDEVDFDWTLSDGARDLNEGYGIWSDRSGLVGSDLKRAIEQAAAPMRAANRRTAGDYIRSVDERDLMEEIVLTARNEGRYYQSRDAEGAVDEAMLGLKKRFEKMLQDMRRDAVDRVHDEWSVG